MKKKLLVALAGFGPLAVFAEGNNASYLDTATATGILNTLQSELTNWVTSAAPTVAAIMGAFLIFWLIRLVYRLVKSAGSTK